MQVLDHFPILIDSGALEEERVLFKFENVSVQEGSEGMVGLL